jgi:hypothetical protein
MNQKAVQSELPSNRIFGYFFAFIFLSLGTYLGFKGMSSVSFVLVLLGAGLSAIATLKSNLLTPLNRLWMQFGVLLGVIISPLIMGLIYFGLFTPMGIVMRLFRRDELRLKVEARQTHWKSRSKQIQDPDAFKNQF